MQKQNDKNDKIEVIFKDYEEVNLNKKGFSVTFKDQKTAYEAFLAFTNALKTIDEDKGKEVLGFDEEK